MTERRLVPDRTFDSLPVFCRETHTHTQFFQSVVSSADLSIDRSTSPYNRSLVSRRPLHRHGPSAVFNAIPRQNHVAESYRRQSTGHRTSPNTNSPSREATTFHISQLVTGLVTANGNKKPS